MRIGGTIRIRGIPGIAATAGALAALVCVVFGAASGASAGDGADVHEVTWAHPAAGSVASFVVTISPVKGPSPSSRSVDLGKPPSRVTGSMQVFSALVAMESDEFISIAAIGSDGRSSPPSAWSGVPPTRPGQPQVVSP